MELDASHPKEVEGWAEAPRRALSAGDLSAILRRERNDLLAAATEYEEHGRPDEGARLRRRAALVERYLADP